LPIHTGPHARLENAVHWHTADHADNGNARRYGSVVLPAGVQLRFQVTTHRDPNTPLARLTVYTTVTDSPAVPPHDAALAMASLHRPRDRARIEWKNISDFAMLKF
jgi:hypothetical protein